MENTVTSDSNSESDISDSWALIDEDSSFEWNNEMGLGPRQVILEEIEVPRTSSRSELSDEESIEVVPDDHTDFLSDNEAEKIKSEKSSTDTDSSTPGNLGLLENEGSKTSMPSTVKDLSPDVQNVPFHMKKCVDCCTTPALIAIFIMGIVGGFAVGCSFAFYIRTSEDSTSVQNTRTLLAKLQNENRFLKHQLHLAHFSSKFAVPNFPKFKDSLQINFDTGHEAIERAFNGDNAGMCTITDFILQSHFRDGNVSADVCLASEKPVQSDYVLTVSENTYDTVPRLEDAALLTEHIEILNVDSNNKSNESGINSGQTDEPSTIHGEKYSVLADASLHNGTQHSKKVLQHVHTLKGQIVNADINNNENELDPRPFTKLRNMVENVYALVSVLGSDIQTSFPSKLELLNILPQNMVHLDFSVESLTSGNYKKITDFKNQMQDSAQKLIGDIESSINRFIKNIANKFKKFEARNIKQICKLKRKLEHSPEKGTVDWNEPIFQKCINFQQSEHADVRNTQTERKDNAPTLASNKEFRTHTGASFDYKKPRDKHGVENRDGSSYNSENQNTNPKHSLSLNKNFEFKEKSEANHDKIDQSNSKSPKRETNILENKKPNKYHVHMQEQERYHTHNSKQVEPNRHLRKRKWKERKQIKVGEKHTEFIDDMHEKYEKQKTFEDSERKYEKDKSYKKKQEDKQVKMGEKHTEFSDDMHEKYKKQKTFQDSERKYEKDKSYKKKQEDKQIKMGEKHTEFSDDMHEKYEKEKTFEDSERKYEKDKSYKKKKMGNKMVNMDGGNISGDWTLKMAHGRAEQRRRAHQSDWVFDRAESRKSSRDKDSKKNTYWYKYEDYSANIPNSDICNKTKAFKDPASKTWKDMKHHVKENVWRPIVDTAKTAKRVFNNFNNYHSHRE